jgi:hypothetical protein
MSTAAEIFAPEDAQGRIMPEHESALPSADFSLEGIEATIALVTPNDPLTGQPLSMLVRASDFHRAEQDCSAEFHHQLHPGNSEELGNNSWGNLLPKGDPDRIEGLAVRHSLGQMTPNWLHDQYHDLFEGPLLPTISVEKHRMVLLGLAKVIPRQAIEITRPGQYRVINLDDQQHQFLTRTTQHEGAGRGWEQNRRGRIGTYLANFALENFLPEIIDDKKVALEVERFMELSAELSDPASLRWDDEDVQFKKGKPTLKQQKKRELAVVGVSIAHEPMMASVEPIRPLFQEAVREGMVSGRKRDIGFVATKYFRQNRFPEYGAKLAGYIEKSQSRTELAA